MLRLFFCFLLRERQHGRAVRRAPYTHLTVLAVKELMKYGGGVCACVSACVCNGATVFFKKNA